MRDKKRQRNVRLQNKATSLVAEGDEEQRGAVCDETQTLWSWKGNLNNTGVVADTFVVAWGAERRMWLLVLSAPNPVPNEIVLGT